MTSLFKALSISLIMMSAALASPGAHGPNGEHLDAPGGHVHSDAGPRVETFTESFELVGHVQGDELSILIDRYETNEPVLNGRLEVEFNGLKAPARFHSDHGDYAVDDAQFLKAIAAPGKHSLIFTLKAGDESDLLEGTLEVGAADNADGHSHDGSVRQAPSLTTWGAASVLIAVAVAGLAISLSRRKSSTGK
jgi:hypothetical protein